MGGLLGARPVRSVLGDGLGHVGDAAGPRGPAIARPHEIHGLVLLAVRSDLHGRVEILEAAERE